MDVILVLLICAWLFGTMISCAKTLFDIDADFDSFGFLEVAFWVQLNLWCNLENHLNTAGIIICIFSVTLFVLPGNLMLMALWLIYHAASKFWTIYKHVFRRKDVDGGNDDESLH